jgi:hypothetical protein
MTECNPGWAETPAVRYFNELKAHKSSDLNEYLAPHKTRLTAFMYRYNLWDRFLTEDAQGKMLVTVNNC